MPSTRLIDGGVGIPNRLVLTLGWGLGSVGHVLIEPNPSLRLGWSARKGSKE